MQHRVLIVTDDADDAAALQDALYKANDGPYEVIWVRLLSEAIGRLSSDNIDVVLIDLSLPDNQGIDTFDKVFEATPQIPILTLSAVDDEVLAIEAVQRGAQGYISRGYFSSTPCAAVPAKCHPTQGGRTDIILRKRKSFNYPAFNQRFRYWHRHAWKSRFFEHGS